MFTGIIEHVGTLRAVRPGNDGCVLEVDLGPLAENVRLGDSVCTAGVCLTARALAGTVMSCDVSAETRRKTTIAGWQAGRRVNLERALRVGDRLGGHIVSGHVDGVGRLAERRRAGDSERFTFLLPEDGRGKAVEKGSLAIDGISLTTWDCRGARVSVAVIPHTLAGTTLADLRPGQPVNLEQDPIGRWVETLLRR
jgi:riboflavin synthase